MHKLTAIAIIAILLLSGLSNNGNAQTRVEVKDTDKYDKIVSAGNSTTYNWSVENNGTRRYNITISVENEDSDWNATTDKTAFDIQPREKVPVTLTVKSPENGKNGTKNQVKVIFIIKPTTLPDFREEKVEKLTNTTIGKKDNGNGNQQIPNNDTEQLPEEKVSMDYYKLVALIITFFILIALLVLYFKKKRKK